MTIILLKVGQNAYALFGGNYDPVSFWPGVVNLWTAEIANFKFGIGSVTGSFYDVGHYTQVVNAQTARVGCGAAQCGGPKLLAYCNYATGQSDTQRPYEAGVSCSKCSAANCVLGALCNCSILCQNNGNLDLSRCVCNCPPGFSGSVCERAV